MNKRCQWLFPVLLLCGSVLLWTPTPTFPTTPNEKKLLSALKSATTNPARQKALTNLYHYYKEEQTPYLTLSYLLKLIDTQKLTGDYAALETSYQNLGDIHQSKRQYLSALHHYFEALVFSTKIKNNRSGYVYLKISKVFRTINRKELAWKYIKKALDYTTKHKDQDLKVLVLSSYSQLYYEEEDYTNAMKFINLSLKAEKNRGKYLDTIQNLYQKSLILLKMEEGTEAMKLLKSAVDTGLETQRYQNLLPVMNQYIERLISLNHLDEATRYLGKIEDIYAPYYPYFFVYYYLEALLNEKKGHTEKALEYYRETTNRLDQYFSKLYLHQYEAFRETTEKIYSSITEFYLEQYNRTKNQLYIRKAIYFSEIKNAYINEFSQLENKGYSHFIKEKRKLEDEFLQYNKNYIRLLNHHKESTRTGNIQPQYFRVQLERYEKKLESLKKQIAELTEFILEAPITYKKYRFKDFNIASIQSKLQTGQKIIKYTVLKEHIYAFVIRKNSVGYRRLTVNTPDTVSLVRELTEPLDDFTKGNVDYLRINYNLQLAHRLYDILLQDLLETGETGGNNENNGNNETTEPGEIFIIPDKELFKLPFEALVTGYNQKELDTNVIFSEYAAADYFVQRYCVSYALSLFHFLKDPPSPRPKSYTIAAYGDPMTDEEGEDPRNRLFRPLPSSKKEILSIQTIFGESGSRVFLGPRFTQRHFETHAPRAEILHIATHFVNNLKHPQYSALLFSGRRQGFPLYYAHDIFKLKLNSRLVVLSACESSEKNLLGMQGLRGMTAAFRHAGARAMMVSMWPVDQQSSQLIPLFYKEYASKQPQKPPVTTSRSLRAAKLKLMEKTDTLETGFKISFAHPFLWANYILYNFSY